MKRAVILVLFLVCACRGLRPIKRPEPAGECRRSEPLVPCGPVPGMGGPQGRFLEGSGLERLHFSALAPGTPMTFPPAAGTQLRSTAACGDSQPRRVRLMKTCNPVTEWAFACNVDVEDGPGICGTPGFDDVIKAQDLLHFRGVMMVRG